MKYNFSIKLVVAIWFALVIILLVSLCGCNEGSGETLNNGEQETNSAAVSDEKGIEIGPDTVEPIARYYGSIRLANFLDHIYDIKVFDGDMHKVEFLIKDYNNVSIQHFWYELDSNFRADTVGQGLQIADVNGDSNEDFILSLGLLGNKNKPSTCFIFDPIQNQYIPLTGFDELCLPKFMPIQQVFLTANFSVHEQFNDEYIVDICYDKYSVVGSDLQFLARLIVYSKINSDEILYTEERVVNGELEIIADRVPKDMINWSDWENEISMYQVLP